MLNLNRNQRTTLKVLFRLICHWNLNSISSHNYAKVFLLKVYVTIHNFDIICFSETFLDSSTPFDDNNVEIKDPPWFNKIIRALIQEKHSAFKNYCNCSRKIDLKCRLKYLQACLNASIEVATEKYYHNTVNNLRNTQKNSKVYWSLLKFFLNNKKILITPIPFWENCFITDFKEKTIFSTFSFLNNALLFLIIALFLFMLTILLTNAYLQVRFQPKLLEKIFKILFGMAKRRYCTHFQKERQTKYFKLWPSFFTFDLW